MNLLFIIGDTHPTESADNEQDDVILHCPSSDEFNDNPHGRSQNTVPIASTQVAIKGTVQYSTRAVVRVVSQGSVLSRTVSD